MHMMVHLLYWKMIPLFHLRAVYLSRRNCDVNSDDTKESEADDSSVSTLSTSDQYGIKAIIFRKL